MIGNHYVISFSKERKWQNTEIDRGLCSVPLHQSTVHFFLLIFTLFRWSRRRLRGPQGSSVRLSPLQMLRCSVFSDSLQPYGLEPARLLFHGIFHTRILEWVAISFSKGSSPPRDWTWVSCIAGKFFTPLLLIKAVAIFLQGNYSFLSLNSRINKQWREMVVERRGQKDDRIRENRDKKQAFHLFSSDYYAWNRGRFSFQGSLHCKLLGR